VQPELKQEINMDAFLIIAFCAALCAVFITGWAIVLAGTAIHAKASGRCVRTAIQPLLDEW
jgi:uncharacterized membrane protein